MSTAPSPIADTVLDEIERLDHKSDIAFRKEDAFGYEMAEIKLQELLRNNCTSLVQSARRERELREGVASLFDAIKHGDDSHQTWLKEAIDSHFHAALGQTP